MSTQNYKNHRQMVPLYHYVLYLIVFACLGLSIKYAYNAFMVTHYDRKMAALLLGLSSGLLLITFFARSFALKAQDRGIRAEENLRHFMLTGKPLDSRLRISQIVALRFAEDSEFLILADRAAADNMKSEDIKKAIINWREDKHRV
ncbi:hypothetical protein BH09BAC2_BH09BAC2_09470 [soil metagenome]